MDFDIAMFDIHDQFISGPSFACVCPLREISQETAACMIDLPKGC